MSVRILGYVMARDEWPLLGLAVVHALCSGVDHVVVVDHASRDSTASELPRLQAAWPGRVTVLRLHAEAFLQESTTAVVMQAVAAAEYDWVYVFDADEFLLADAGCDLADLLQTVPESIGAVRYEVHNWVAPTDMDDADPEHYRRVVRRAVPCIFTSAPSDVLSSDIECGDASVFDVPFGSKLVVRGAYAHALRAGAHGLLLDEPVVEEPVAPDVLRAGHLPLLSWPRLELKCRQGQALIDAGFPRSHGWQSQTLRRIELTGNLKSFWRTHSMPAEPARSSSAATPTTVEDLALSAALTEASARLASCAPLPLRGDVDVSSQAEIDLDRLIAMRQQLANERDQAMAEAAHPRSRHADGDARLLIATLTSQLDSVTELLAGTERARLDTERELNAVLSSRSWRWTKPLRGR